MELLDAEPERVVPAYFAAGQSTLGIELLDKALAGGSTPDAGLVSEARGRFEQALDVLPS